MLATRKIRCVMIVASAENDGMPRPSQPRFRPSDLLPWADPHIRGLVEQLQEEVRHEAASGAAKNRLAERWPDADETVWDDPLC